MPLWRLVPVAAAEDSRWLDYERWAEVVVRAPSASKARLIAANTLSGPSDRIGNESPAERTGLEDEKLYRAERKDAADVDAAAEGPDEVIRAVPLSQYR